MKKQEDRSHSPALTDIPTFGAVPPFVAEDILARKDIQSRQSRLAAIVSEDIIPRLVTIHRATLKPGESATPPTQEEIANLASLVLGPDIDAAAAYITDVKQRGLTLDVLFVELLEPAARYLGQMWEEDRCDFIDVTLGVGRLQQLLAIFNETHSFPALGEMRSVLMMSVAGEQHMFGISMVERFLRAAGWQVRTEMGLTSAQVEDLVSSQWFAVVGITLSCDSRLDAVSDAIKAIRHSSCNHSIGVMVGGPAFTAHPEYAGRVGADATAASAPTAVLIAQKLFDLGVTTSAKTPSAS